MQRRSFYKIKLAAFKLPRSVFSRLERVYMTKLNL